ncbi:MAG: PKD domain-containing protein [Planctomycetota bacterium]
MHKLATPLYLSAFLCLSSATGVLGVEQDVTKYGTPIARVTQPVGGGNWDIEVIRDGVFPPTAIGIDAGPSSAQYDTWDGANTADEDWVGYEFAGELTFTKLVFQEGKHFFDGGYFDPPESLVVQVLGADDEWTVAGGSWNPPYQGLSTGGQIIGFETFTWTLDPPAEGKAIRIWGEPGGTADFISVGELRAFADLDGDLPAAAFTCSPKVGSAPLAVSFDASASTGTALSFDWDFGDGATGTGVTATHTYTSVGSFLVTLTVTATLSGVPFEAKATAQVVVGLRVSDIGRPIALFPNPTGGGNHDIEVIRDGVKPALAFGTNAGSSAQQFDTYHGGGFTLEDWIGYKFDCTFTISMVVFQEGKHFFDGGYFDPPGSLVVQYREPGTGDWLPADGEWDPPYQGEYTDGQIICFETFVWEIPGGVEADGIRIYGTPGGSAYFTSVAELEVFADSDDIIPAAVFTATPTEGGAPLAVTFDASASIGKDLAYAWDFGDGETGTGKVVTHTYTRVGNFTAKLTVTAIVEGSCVATSTATTRIKTAFNLAPLGEIIARVTVPLGGGNHDPEVIRDGVRPAVTIGENAGDSQLQYDTWDGANLAEEDWIGYTFGCQYRFAQLVFQEGKHFFDGGYFDPPESLVVQIHNPATDSWVDAPGDWEPPYQGQYTDMEIRNFETFVWNIDPPTQGDGIRIYGTPGGSADFISVAELEVYVAGVLGTAPRAAATADVRAGVAPLTVTFDGSTSTAPAGSRYEWDFGDGGTAAGVTAIHTYTAPGVYRARLTVTSLSGVCSVASIDVRVYPSPFTTLNGFVRQWLILGPYVQAGGANPAPEIMEGDYLTDGIDFLDSDILPREGLAVPTDYAIAQSDGLATVARSDANPDGVPTWLAWQDGDDTIDVQEVYQTIPLDNVMVYACVYVTNELAEPLVLDIGCGSDDAIEVILGDAIVHTNSVARGWGAAEEIQDVIAAVTLPPKVKVRLLVKVFQGGGGVGFRLRFQKADGTPVFEPDISFSLEPGEGTEARFRRGDSNADGAINITDGVFTLNYLFLGGPEPPCAEAADANDDGAANITDGIYILNYLFLGGPAPPAPGPDVCGPDPAGSPALGCVSYTKC